MFPARINFRWDGDIHGNHAFGWEWIFVRGRVECSQLESISDGMETSMVITHLDGNGFL